MLTAEIGRFSGPYSPVHAGSQLKFKVCFVAELFCDLLPNVLNVDMNYI